MTVHGLLVIDSSNPKTAGIPYMIDIPNARVMSIGGFTIRNLTVEERKMLFNLLTKIDSSI